MPLFLRNTFAVLALALALVACRESKVVSYTIPKEKDAAVPGMPGSAASPNPHGGMAGATVPVSEGPGLSWTAPADWKSKPGSAMRKGSYDVPLEGGGAADMSITAFPGAVGGELANINRWRGQVQLQPVEEADLGDTVAHFQQNGLTFMVVDCAGQGASAQRILGAIVPFGDGLWFFKITGPEAPVEKVKPAFLDFLKSVKPPPAP